MTWIVGRPVPFGYAVALSDICVTLASGSEVDCLQKVHAVAANVAVGFAGSVQIGLAMVDRLREFLRLPAPGLGWDPVFVAENFPAVARAEFAAADPRERANQCQLLVLAVHPSRNNGDAPWALSYVHRLESPTFDATAAGPTHVVSIGSGTDVAAYSSALSRLNAQPHRIHALERQGPAGSSLGLLLSIESAIEDAPAQGISPHLHVCVVRREGITIRSNDKTVYSNPIQDFRMPKVATSLRELGDILRQRSSTPNGAVC